MQNTLLIHFEHGCKFVIFSFSIQSDTPQNVYKKSMNRWQQVITGVDCNRKAAMQGATSRYTGNYKT